MDLRVAGSSPAGHPLMPDELKFKLTKRQRSIWPVGAVLVLILAGAAAWFLSSHRPKPSDQPAQVVTDDPTITTKKFHKFGFSLEYPKTWKVNEKELAVDFIASASLDVLRKEKGGEKTDYADVTFEVKPNLRQLSLKEFADDQNKELFASYSKTDPLEISGHEAIYYGNTEEEANRFPVLIVLIKKNDQEVVMASLRWFYDLKDNNLAPLFDEVLTTFRFD